jgi:hypothetical protein
VTMHLQTFSYIFQNNILCKSDIYYGHDRLFIILVLVHYIVKLYIFIHNEVRDFDKNSTQPEIRVNRIRDNESQLYL